MTQIVGIVIPCYKTKGLVDRVINDVLRIKEELKEKYLLKIYLINDCCPEMSWQTIRRDSSIKIIHNPVNLGVGASTLKGFHAALADKCDYFIKMDADGQHNPIYLNELILYLSSLPEFELTLIKGTRYFWPETLKNVPFDRRFGSLILEPIVRAAISYRLLTDFSNGFLGFNLKTMEHMLFLNLGRKLKPRYLFESSILEKCSLLGCEIHEFSMASRYDKEWRSSLKSIDMILPLIIFWSKSIFKRIFNKYVLSMNLGSLLLISSASGFIYAFRLYFERIKESIEAGILVSAGTSAIFTSVLTMSLLAFFMFALYDYSSGKKVKKIIFRAFIKDLNNNY